MSKPCLGLQLTSGLCAVLRMWQASAEVWSEVLSHVHMPSIASVSGKYPAPCVVVITDACATAALLCRALGLDSDRLTSFK